MKQLFAFFVAGVLGSIILSILIGTVTDFHNDDFSYSIYGIIDFNATAALMTLMVCLCLVGLVSAFFLFFAFAQWMEDRTYEELERQKAKSEDILDD